ncbi:MAG: Xaa-Pro peptidase family protein [Myxococcota bacterium]|jgi:Xaa-Pro aminopeptidase|nr:Xaa-Pro peptidase family protein [Myxococcota bacterium]
MNLIEQKISQAVRILQEHDIDLWLTFVRESATIPDPVIDMVIGQHCTWQTAWLISSTGQTIAIAGSLDVAAIKDKGHFKEVVPYVQGIGSTLLEVLNRLAPRSIAINYSTDSVMADGLTLGMYRLLSRYLEGTPYLDRLLSSQEIVATLRGRKTQGEIDRMQKAVDITLAIYDELVNVIAPGVTEKQIADYITRRAHEFGVEPAWERDHCPAVFTGPAHAGAHFRPTERCVEAGHVINTDFGVKVEGYCSDLQRTWYVRRAGERCAPAEVQRGFDVLIDSIHRAYDVLRPGALSWEVDAAARQTIVDAGYPEYPHALGHQVGRAAHDGGIGLYPKWERYGALPFGKVEAGQVFTIEPRLPIESYGVATVEEMVWVTDNGNVMLSKPQTELILI